MSYSFTFSKPFNLTGTFQGSQPTSVYIMDPSEFSDFKSSVASYALLYRTGTTVSMSVNLPAGTYYIVFQGFEGSTTTVTITQDFAAILPKRGGAGSTP